MEARRKQELSSLGPLKQGNEGRRNVGYGRQRRKRRKEKGRKGEES